MNLCGFNVGIDKPLFLIAGPCVIENQKTAFETAVVLKDITTKLKIPFIYKSSFDKANRTSLSSYRGPGIEAGLKILSQIRDDLELPVLTDVHEYTPLDEVADVVSIMQTPAFLCRQTDFILRVCGCKKPVNIKKGQFLSPEEMQYVVEKAKSSGNEQIMICERGTTFGYNNLIVDMRGLATMREFDVPVVFDATHSVQQPGKQGGKSGGNRQMIPVLARAAVAAGVSGLFMETHPNPDLALSDGPNSWSLSKMETLLTQLIDIDTTIKNHSFLEQEKISEIV